MILNYAPGIGISFCSCLVLSVKSCSLLILGIYLCYYFLIFIKLVYMMYEVILMDKIKSSLEETTKCTLYEYLVIAEMNIS